MSDDLNPRPIPVEALLLERDARIRELEADRDKGGQDYCALMERYDAEFSRAEAAEARIRELEMDRTALIAAYSGELGDGFKLIERAEAAEARLAEAVRVLRDLVDLCVDVATDPHGELGLDYRSLAEARAFLASLPKETGDE